MAFIKRGMDKVMGFFGKKEETLQQKQQPEETAQEKEDVESIKALVSQNHASAQALSRQLEAMRSVLSNGSWDQKTKSAMDGLLVAVQNKLSGNVEAVAEVKDLDKAAQTLIDTIVGHSEKEDADILSTALNALVKSLTEARYSVKENIIKASVLDLRHASLLIQRATLTRSLHALMEEKTKVLDDLHKLQSDNGANNALQQSEDVNTVYTLTQQIQTYTSLLDSLNAEIRKTETLREQYINATDSSLVDQIREEDQKLAEQLFEDLVHKVNEIAAHSEAINKSMVRNQYNAEMIQRMLPGKSNEIKEISKRLLAEYQKTETAVQQTEGQSQEDEQTDEEADKTLQLHV